MIFGNYSGPLGVRKSFTELRGRSKQGSECLEHGERLLSRT